MFLVAVLVLFKQKPRARRSASPRSWSLIYIPMGYYTDLFLYRRRQRKKAAEKQKAQAKQAS